LDAVQNCKRQWKKWEKIAKEFLENLAFFSFSFSNCKQCCQVKFFMKQNKINIKMWSPVEFEKWNTWLRKMMDFEF
jgi:hypothetical protein